MLYGMLTGRIGKDGDLRFLATGTAILSISVATDTGFGDRKKTVWVNCKVWGKRAESLAPYIKKGSEISLVGELSENEWNNDQGTTIKNLEMNVTEIQLIGGKPVDANQNTSQNQQQSAPQQPSPQGRPEPQTHQQTADNMASGFVDDKDIPFIQHERFLL